MCVHACLCFQLFLLLSLKALQVNLVIAILFFLPQTLFLLLHYLGCKDCKEIFKQNLILKEILSCIHFIDINKYSYHICLPNPQRPNQGITMMVQFKEFMCVENMDLIERHVHCTTCGHIPETEQQMSYRWETTARRQMPNKSWAWKRVCFWIGGCLQSLVWIKRKVLKGSEKYPLRPSLKYDGYCFGFATMTESPVTIL